MSKFNVGDKVKYIGNNHEEMPEFYPEIGTIGIIKDIKTPNAWVQWSNGSTSESDCWCCSLFDIEKIIENMTNEEIWKMLTPKMEKNGLVSKVSVVNTHVEDFPNGEVEITKAYYEDDVINAIAVAYKSGYLRAMKGRPFKIGEKKGKKKGGHWEPVDPNNLPKEGTRVRYSRVIEDTGAEPFSKWTGIQIGEETIINRNHGEFWVEDIHNKNHGYPLCSNLHPERFDVWVEDDE